jgi:hypothetical protein
MPPEPRHPRGRPWRSGGDRRRALGFAQFLHEEASDGRCDHGEHPSDHAEEPDEGRGNQQREVPLARFFPPELAHLLSQVVAPLLDDAAGGAPTEDREVDVVRLDDSGLGEARGDVGGVGDDGCAEALVGRDLGCADGGVELVLWQG